MNRVIDAFLAYRVRRFARRADSVALIKMIQHKNSTARALAITACGDLRLEAAKPHLMKLVLSADRKFQWSVAQALYKIHGDESPAKSANAVANAPWLTRHRDLLDKAYQANDLPLLCLELLVGMLCDRDDLNRQTAEGLLITMGDPVLWRMREIMSSVSTVPSILGIATARILVSLDDQGWDAHLMPFITRLLTTPSSLTYAEKQSLVELIKEVGKTRNAIAIAALTSYLCSNLCVHETIAEALAFLQRDSGFLIGQFADTRDYRARSNLLIALGVIGDDRAVDMLLQYVNEPIDPIREASIQGLVRTGSPKAMDTLLKLMRGRQASVIIRAILDYGSDAMRAAVPAMLSEKLPPYAGDLVGMNPITVRNPNGFSVVAGIRSGPLGKNVAIQSNGYNTVCVPNGTYDIYFVYSSNPDAMFQGDGFTLNNNRVEIHIVKVLGGNYHIRQIT